MSRPIRDTPGDSTRITTAILRRNGCPAPEAVTAELMAAYLGNHLAIVDTTPPEDPNAGYHRPPEHALAPPPATETPTPGLAAYLAARGKTPADTTQEGQQ